MDDLAVPCMHNTLQTIVEIASITTHDALLVACGTLFMCTWLGSLFNSVQIDES